MPDGAEESALDGTSGEGLNRGAMNPRHVLMTVVASGFLTGAASHGQEAGVAAARVEQAQRFRIGESSRAESRRRLDGVVDDIPATPGDPDLGQQVILRKREKVTPFTLFANTSAFYTNNAALTDEFTVDDYFFVAEAGVSYQRQIVRDLYAETTIRQAVFRYAEYEALDFESLNVGAGLTYIVRPLWGIALTARYNYNRLTDGQEHDEFFTNQTLTLNVLKTFELSKAHYFYAGYSSVFGWSDPVAPQRDEHGIFAGYRANLTRSLAAEVFYRGAYFDYVNDRGDWNQTLALSFRWEPAKWISLSLSASLGFNNSNRDVFDYEVFNGGLGLAGNITF
jgi:hypothetical protein